MKKLVSALLSLLLILLLVSVAAQERGFDTPEACARALFDALQTQDAKAMEACLAFDELAASYDFQAQAERLNALTPSMLLPASDAFAAASNAAALRSAWYRKLAGFNLSVISPAMETVYAEYRTISGKDEAFTQALDAVSQLAGFNAYALLRFDGILTPDQIPVVKDRYYTENMEKIIQRDLAVWGMETYADIAISVSVIPDTLFVGDAQYMIPLRLYQIDGRWLIDPNPSMIGNLLGVSAGGFLVELPGE